MAVTDVSICNLALTHLGAEEISSLDESSREAVVCKTAYESTKLSVLRDHFWGFALSRAVLSPNGSTPSFGFRNTFNLPSTAELWRFVDDANVIKQEGRTLLSDATTIKLEYVKSDVLESQFDSKFVNAFSLKLAEIMCYRITQNVSLIGVLNARYADAIKDAKRANAISSTPDSLIIDTFTSVRL